jgi:acetylglutamate kinase
LWFKRRRRAMRMDVRLLEADMDEIQDVLDASVNAGMVEVIREAVRALSSNGEGVSDRHVLQAFADNVRDILGEGGS